MRLSIVVAAMLLAAPVSAWAQHPGAVRQVGHWDHCAGCGDWAPSCGCDDAVHCHACAPRCGCCLRIIPAVLNGIDRALTGLFGHCCPPCPPACHCGDCCDVGPSCGCDSPHGGTIYGPPTPTPDALINPFEDDVIQPQASVGHPRRYRPRTSPSRYGRTSSRAVPRSFRATSQAPQRAAAPHRDRTASRVAPIRSASPAPIRTADSLVRTAKPAANGEASASRPRIMRVEYAKSVPAKPAAAVSREPSETRQAAATLRLDSSATRLQPLQTSSAGAAPFNPLRD